MAAPPPVNRSRKKPSLLASPLPINSIDQAPYVDSMTLTTLETEIEINQQEKPKVDRKKKKGKKKKEEAESLQSPHLSYGIYEKSEWEIEYDNPENSSAEDGKPKKPPRGSFLGKMFHREKSSSSLDKSGDVPAKFQRQNSVPDLDIATYGGRASVINDKMRKEIDQSRKEDVLPETAEEFFAELDEKSEEITDKETQPKPIKERVILEEVPEEVVEAAKRNYERNVFDLQLFYHKVDPKKKDAEQKSRDLLAKYPPGNVALALEKKYGEIPIGWDKYLKEAKSRIQG